jgi:hypothetical protein
MPKTKPFLKFRKEAFSILISQYGKASIAIRNPRFFSANDVEKKIYFKYHGIGV